jgi:hypothetical protein
VLENLVCIGRFPWKTCSCLETPSYPSWNLGETQFGAAPNLLQGLLVCAEDRKHSASGEETRCKFMGKQWKTSQNIMQREFIKLLLQLFQQRQAILPRQFLAQTMP